MNLSIFFVSKIILRRNNLDGVQPGVIADVFSRTGFNVGYAWEG